VTNQFARSVSAGLCLLAVFTSSCTKTTGSIQVNSTPTGAMVWLDFDSTGKVTNCRFDNVQPGHHALTARLAGYRDYDASADVIAGQTAVVDCPLSRPRYAWMIQYSPGEQANGRSVAPVSDGYVVAGGLGDASDFDLAVLKFDLLGQVCWTKRYVFGLYVQELAQAMVPVGDGGFAICGFSWERGDSGDAWLARIDSQGDTLWAKGIGRGREDVACDLVQTSDGGFAAAGYIWTCDSLMYDVFLVRTDADGDTLWTRSWGGQYFDIASGIVQTPDGGFMLAGYTDSYGGGYRNFWVLRTDADGDTLWTRTYGGASNEECSSIARTSDNCYVLAGYTQSYGAGRLDYYLVKIDDSGNVLWTRTYGGANDDWAYSVRQTFDGGYAVCGYNQSGTTAAWLVKTDANGETLWTRTYNPEGNACEGYCVRQTPDSGYVITGAGGGNVLVLIKTDTRGYATP